MVATTMFGLPGTTTVLGEHCDSGRGLIGSAPRGIIGQALSGSFEDVATRVRSRTRGVQVHSPLGGMDEQYGQLVRKMRK